jgi:hypothetical protein
MAAMAACMAGARRGCICHRSHCANTGIRHKYYRSPCFTMRSFLALFGTLCYCLVLGIPAVDAAEVHVLTDATFEHQTQASTGQTTGKWLVKFYAPWCEYAVKWFLCVCIVWFAHTSLMPSLLS